MLQNLAELSSLDQEIVLNSIQLIEKYVDADVVSLSLQVTDTYNLKIDSGFWTDLTGNEIIEIYNLANARLYVSPNFIKLNTYPVRDLFSYPWFELYERDEFITRRLQEMAIGLLNGSITASANVDVPSHVVRERFSDEKRGFLVRILRAAPVFNAKGELYGIITANELTPLEN